MIQEIAFGCIRGSWTQGLWPKSTCKSIGMGDTIWCMLQCVPSKSAIVARYIDVQVEGIRKKRPAVIILILHQHQHSFCSSSCSSSSSSCFIPSVKQKLIDCKFTLFPRYGPPPCLQTTHKRVRPDSVHSGAVICYTWKNDHCGKCLASFPVI